MKVALATSTTPAATGRRSRGMVTPCGVKVKGLKNCKQRKMESPALHFSVIIWKNPDFYFLLFTMASIAATAVTLRISCTELSKSMKWMGLFNPIWMGPMISTSGLRACNIL